MRAGAPLRRLGTMSVETFVRRYWQRRALCIRKAIADFTNPVDRADLLALAADPDVESRLVRHSARGWQLRHGPFSARQVPAMGQPDWTLLVQGVDLHRAAVAQLAARFRFLPVARFDDVMISLAGDGGGVGPHVDQYDVFLLQAQGRRRWRIARQFDPALVAGLPLKVLANFAAQDEWILEPGDALYLPPGVAHEGVALGPCMTISVGFRLPAWQELVETWHERQARTAPRTGRLHDGTRTPTPEAARLPASMIDAAAQELRRITVSRRDAARTLLEHLSEPKPTVVYDTPRPALPAARFAASARKCGVILDLRSRLLFAGADFAINGELVPVAVAARSRLRRLANRGSLEAARIGPPETAATEPLMRLLYDWYRCGWLHLAAL